MKYLGGKQTLGIYISKFIIEKTEDKNMSGYFEPFCGALGVLKQALVPYFLYVAQKRMQRKVKKSRRRRR